MDNISTSFPNLLLTRPDPKRDAPFAVQWFTANYGKETLLLMGNLESSINPPTLDSEAARIYDFLQLEKAGQQLTWMIRYNNKTIGAVWIELIDTNYIRSPAVHIMIGDKNHRGKGIGKTIMREMINYAKNTLKAKSLYSRYLVSNVGMAHLSKTLGFTNDGLPYKDTDGLEFQNIKIKF